MHVHHKASGRCFFSSRSGFSLLEAALALVIAGLLAGGTVPLYRALRHQKAQETTRHRKEVILMALAQHVLDTGLLPCPARNDSTGASGEAAESCDVAPLHVGPVPFRTLGLAPEYALDGYQRPWVLVVWPPLTRKGSKSRAYKPEESSLARFCSAHGTLLHLFDTANQPVHLERDPLAAILLTTNDKNLLADPARHEAATRPWATSGNTQENSPAPGAVYWITRRHLLQQYGGTSCPSGPPVQGFQPSPSSRR